MGIQGARPDGGLLGSGPSDALVLKGSARHCKLVEGAGSHF